MRQIPFPVIDLQATGENILRLRKEAGYSVRDLQQYLGFEQPQAIYKWQRGECLPTFDNMYAIACYFNVTIDDILVGNRQDFLFPRNLSYILKMPIKHNKKQKFLCTFPLE